MDINSAEKSIQKLLAYVKDLADSKPKMYRKSRGRLKELAETCNEVVSLISVVLQDEILDEDDVEFGSKPNLTSVLDNMQNQITQMRNFAGIELQQSALSKPKQPEPTSDKSTEPSVSKKKILRNYRETLQAVANKSYKYDAVGRCAELLWHWFEVRFVTTVHTDGFRYNMKRFPLWIRDIVILYGKAIRDNSYIEFDNQFRHWVDSLVSDDSEISHKYAVPYSIFSFEKSMSAEQFTLESVVLWDMLMDSGLSAICSPASNDYMLNEDAVYLLCSEYNPEVLDMYADYVTHPEVLINLGWEVKNA